MKKLKEKIIGSCVVILMGVMCVILCRAFVENIVTPKWKITDSITVGPIKLSMNLSQNGITNSITNFILKKPEKSLPRNTIVSVNWEKLYPFPKKPKTASAPKQENAVTKLNALKGRVNGWEKRISAYEGKISDYSNKNLWGFQKWVEMKMAYEKYLGWNMCRDIRWIGNDYLTYAHLGKVDKTKKIQAVTVFYRFCQKQGISFLFIQAPYKTSRQAENDIFPVLGNVNAHVDALVNGLRANQVPVLDIRDVIEKEHIDYLPLFFKTDHHWLPETGLWAAGLIAEKLHAMPDVQLAYDPAVLKESEYRKVLYPKIYLGSQGRKVTLARAEPEDMNLLYPKMKTQFRCIVPRYKIDKSGDFSALYDMKQMARGDYYQISAYHTYGYGDTPFIRIQNLIQNFNDKKILVIKDSFGDTTIPFLAMVVKQVDGIDLRHFTGSLRNFILQTRPDAVLILYNADMVENQINWNSHTDFFDFR